MISKIGSKPLKGVFLQAELCKVVNSIRVRGVTKNYTKDYFQLYFESHKRSGGGPVTSIQLLGNGEAIVTFQDPRGVLFEIPTIHTIKFFQQLHLLPCIDLLQSTLFSAKF